MNENAEANVELIPSGGAYFCMLGKLIDGATHTIHLQVYIFSNDETGKVIIEKLCLAAARGIKIYLVVDGYASADFDKELMKKLFSQGIYVKRFSPIHVLRLKIGRRLHHKIIVVDNIRAMVGGINIADKYNKVNEDEPWLDNVIYVTGPVVNEINNFCLKYLPNAIRKKLSANQKPNVQSINTTNIKLIQNDWWRKKTEISTAYNRIFRESKKEITIVASYFFPGFIKRRLLLNAANRGVRITIITAAYSDVWIMKPAIKYLYGLLLRNNIQIYEWNRSILHSKIAVADDNWSTIGSYNLNALSDYGSTEANIEVLDENFYKICKRFIDDIILKGSNAITPNEYFSIKSRLLQPYRWFCYHVIRIIFRILFWIMRWTKSSNTNG